jgi:hypothetical protein
MPLTFDTPALAALQGGAPEDIGDVVTLLEQLRAYVNSLSGAVWAPGDLKGVAHSTPGTGWLLCDGTLVSRATYAALFGVIGSTYGAGDGATTFALPDYRGRTLVMPDGAAGRLTANDALGNTGGAEKHTPAITDLPADSHLIRHIGVGLLNNVNFATSGSGSGVFPRYPTGDAGFDEMHTGDGSGAGTPYSIMPPYGTANILIKT